MGPGRVVGIAVAMVVLLAVAGLGIYVVGALRSQSVAPEASMSEAMAAQRCVAENLGGDAAAHTWSLVSRACRELSSEAGGEKARCVLKPRAGLTSDGRFDLAVRECDAADWVSMSSR
jgi:hypothetical protein